MAINTPTLSLVDNADGTGAVATVGNATVGTTNTIYVADWSGGMVGATFASKGSRTGSGTISVSVLDGHHWAYVVSASGPDIAVSLVQGFRTTSGADAIYFQILEAVQAKIDALAFNSIDKLLIDSVTEQITTYVSKFPWNRNDMRRGIHITPTRETIERVVNSSDDFAFGVQVTVVQASNQDLTTGIEEEMELRQRLIGAFQPTPTQEPLAGVSDVFDVVIEPGPVFDPSSFLNQHDVQALLLRFKVRRQRGLT